MTRLQVSPLTGRTIQSVWSDVLTVRSAAGEHCIYVCSLEGESAAQIGRALLLDLQSYRYSTPENLFNFLQTLNLQVAQHRFSCAVVVAAQNTYICAAFQAAIYIQRQTKVKLVLPVSDEWNMVTGIVHTDDITMLFTENGASAVLPHVSLHEKIDVDTLVTQLVPKIHQLSKNGDIACAFIEQKQDQNSEKVEKRKLNLSRITSFFKHVSRLKMGVLGIVLVSSAVLGYVLFGQKTPTSSSSGQISSDQSPEKQATVNLDDTGDLPIYYDMRLAVPDFVATIAAGNQEYIFAIDTQQQTGLLLNVTTKQVISRVDPIFSRARSVAVIPGEGFVILSSGIYLIPFTATELIPQTLKEEGDSNRQASLIGAFGPYVYVLNPVKRSLYRYAKQKEEYSSPIGWLQDPLGVSYDAVTSLAVDGDVWITTDAGELKKFTAGKTTALNLDPVEPKIVNPIFLATAEESPALYILEPAAKRIVIYSKDGQFLKQITSPSLAAAQTLILNVNDNTLSIINGSLVYALNL